MDQPEFTPTRILVIDDDIKLCHLIREYLAPLGYDVSLAHNGPQGVELAVRETFAAIILDVMLPGFDGFQALRKIRMSSSVPVLMLTARGEENDRIAGLEMGADDYLPKTFSTRELLARLRAVIRRSVVSASEAASKPAGKVTVGVITIDPQSREVKVAGECRSFTTIEFDLLLSLAQSAGRVKSREQLLLEVAERNFDVFDRSIDVHISSIRKKLGDDPKEPLYIVTIRSAGYMLRRPSLETAP